MTQTSPPRSEARIAPDRTHPIRPARAEVAAGVAPSAGAEPGRGPARDTSRPRDVRDPVFALVVVAIYTGIGLVAFWPVLPGTSGRIFGIGGDSILAMWFLAWIPHALAHGLNPFFSHAIFEPAGVNLAQNTESPFLGLVTVPFSLFMGPVARANLLMVLAMPASASAAFFVLRKWAVWGPAAALGGLVYGFSAYSIGQGLGHVVLMFLPLPPIIALTIASILRQERPPVRLGIQLGLLMAVQFLCEPEIMTTVAIVAVWSVVCVALRFPGEVAGAVRSCATAFGTALVVALAILAYPIWMMLEGPQHYTGTAQPVPNPYFNDLLSFINPGPLQRVSFGIHLHGVVLSDPSEAGAYIGIPVLIVAAILFWRSRQTARMQVAGAILFGTFLLSLGSHLVVDGKNTHVPLPFSLLEHAPLLNNVLPSRLSLEIVACLAAILAFGLDDLHEVRQRAHRHSSVGRAAGVVAFAVALVVVVVTQLPVWPYASQSVRTLPEPVQAAIPAGTPLAITYPFASPVYSEPMLWQAEDNFGFRLVGGYAEHPDTNGHPTGFPNPTDPPQLASFLEGQEGYLPQLKPLPVDQELIVTIRSALVANHIDVVIVDPTTRGSAPVIDVFTRALGPATVSTPTADLWVRSAR